MMWRRFLMATPHWLSGSQRAVLCIYYYKYKSMKINRKITKALDCLRLHSELSVLKLSLIWFIAWSKTDSKLVAVLVQSVIARFEIVATTRGRMTAIDELKAARLAFTRWLCGKPLTGNVGAPIAKNGLPKVIPVIVRSKLLKDPDDFLIKAVITVLSIGRYFKGGKPVDYESITAPSTPILPKDGEILLALKKMKVEVGRDIPSEWKFSWITTAGPNGPSISSSLQDLPKFVDRFKEQVAVMLPDFLKIIDKNLMYEKTHKLSNLLGLDKFRNDSLRKISIKDDREGKSRPFAIFDYWSQTTLSPLHDWVFSTLKKIPQDCTFNQTEGVVKIQKTESRKYFYSYDLKSATDRFPVELQEKVLSLIFNTDYASAWRSLMTKESFRIPNGDPVKFLAGQPLGAKSSWGVFTLCHHVVVNIASIRTNSDANYVILGDDIVLRGRALATEYKRIMSLLGVSISESKSHVSKDTFEFAKNWIHKGKNLSGFPLVGVAETIMKPLELAAIMVFEAPAKGYHYSIDPRSVSQFFSVIATYSILPHRKAVYIASKVVWCYSFLSWLSTRDSEWAKLIVQLASNVVSPPVAQSLLVEVVGEKWKAQLEKTLWAFQDFGFDMLEKISKLPPFKSVWDSKAWPGRLSASGIEFSANARSVPLFGALQNEGDVKYSDFFQRKLENDEDFTIDDIEALKLPPRPQLKGFEPIRSKESIRTLSLIGAGLNRDLMTKCSKIRADVYSLNK